MENVYSRQFDLTTLLKTSGIDIRLAIRSNVSLRLDEYYSLLSRFVHYAPHIIETLERIAIHKANSLDFLTMTGVEEHLSGIGCNKFTTIIDDIVKAGKMGHNDFAASLAKRLLTEFRDFCAHIKKAQKQGTTFAAANTDGSAGEHSASTFETAPLKNILERMEREEATRKMRILAIDDSPVMLKTISSILGEDYVVNCMSNPAMLEKFLEQITPELFLLDYKMPEINGFDLVPIIRSFEEHKHTPIVFLTSEGTSDHVSAALTLGARDFIVKPFQANILQEKVAKHIVKKNLLKRKAA
jgi:CheY-like chemotaxis protein